MDGIQQYKIFYMQTATEDIKEKSDYIAFQLHDLDLAEKWYFRLRRLILENLSTFPLKYSLYDVEPWKAIGIRQFVTRNDVVLYSVDAMSHTVYIWAVCTRGQDVAAHLESLE